MSTVLVEPEIQTTTSTDVRLMRRAAGMLLEFDWRQHLAGSREEGAMCMLGAARESAYDMFAGIGAMTVVLTQLHLRLGREFPNMPSLNECGLHPAAQWNDQPGRTKQQVVDRMLEIADRWEAEGATA